MAITIPSAVFSKYEEFADAMIDNLGVKCTIVYPPKRETSSGRPAANLGRRSGSIYRTGGPQGHSTSFPLGDAAFKLTEVTEDVTLRVYWNSKDWVNVGIQLDVSNNVIQTIGYITDLPKLEKADKLIVSEKIKGYGTLAFERMGEPYPMGLRQNRYVAIFWKRV